MQCAYSTSTYSTESPSYIASIVFYTIRPRANPQNCSSSYMQSINESKPFTVLICLCVFEIKELIFICTIYFFSPRLSLTRMPLKKAHWTLNILKNKTMFFALSACRGCFEIRQSKHCMKEAFFVHSFFYSRTTTLT